LRSGELGGHMSGAMKSGVLRHVSSIVSRVYDALSCWKVNNKAFITSLFRRC